MAQNQMTKSKFIGLLAFIALLISGVCKLVAIIGGNLGIIDIIGQACLIISVLMSAYTFAKTCSRNWQITYWIIAALAIVGIIINIFQL